MLRRISLFLACGITLLTAVVLCHPANAALIYGDIAGNTVGSGYSVGPGGGLNNAIAEGFTMTQSYNLQSANLILTNFTPGPGSNLALSIYSDAGNKPGVDLYDLSSNVTLATSGSPTTVTLTGSGSFLLAAGTKYWLDFYATNSASQTGSNVQWDGEFSGGGFAVPTGPGATEIGQERSVSGGNPPGGSPTTNELRTAFQLNGTPVPEPSAILLAGIAAAAIACFRRRRSQR